MLLDGFLSTFQGASNDELADVLALKTRYKLDLTFSAVLQAQANVFLFGKGGSSHIVPPINLNSSFVRQKSAFTNLLQSRAPFVHERDTVHCKK